MLSEYVRKVEASPMKIEVPTETVFGVAPIAAVPEVATSSVENITVEAISTIRATEVVVPAEVVVSSIQDTTQIDSFSHLSPIVRTAEVASTSIVALVVVTTSSFAPISYTKVYALANDLLLYSIKVFFGFL